MRKTTIFLSLLALAAIVAVLLFREAGSEAPSPREPSAPATVPAPAPPEPAPEPEPEPAPVPPATLTVSFSVRDRLLGHERLKSVRVVVGSADGASEGRELGVGDDGAFWFEDLPPGEYGVEAVEGADRTVGRRTVVLRPGDSAEITFDLDPPCAVDAEVLGLTAGAPAELQFWSAALLHGEPDVTLPVASDRAAGEVAPGTYWVHVVREGARLGVFSWTIRTSPERRTFDLRGLVTVSGTVTGGGDGAAAPTRVVFSPTDPGDLPVECPVDAAGAWSVELSGDRVYGISVLTGRGAVPFDARRFGSDTRLDLSLSETGRLEARFTDRATGRPLADVPVFFSGPGASFTLRTDEDGRLRTELRPGPWYAMVKLNGAQVSAFSWMGIRAGETARVEVALDVPEPGFVAGRVTFQGRPVSGVEVTATGLVTCVFARTDDRGRFRLAPVFDRMTRVHVLQDADRGSADLQVDVAVGSPDVLLELPPLAAGRIRFRGPDGLLRRTLSGLVTVRSPKMGFGFKSGPDGVVRSLGLPPGGYDLHVTLNEPFVTAQDTVHLELPLASEDPVDIDVVPAIPGTLAFDPPFRGWLAVLPEGPAPDYFDTPSWVYTSASEARIPRKIPPGTYRVVGWGFDGRVAEGRARLDESNTRIEMRMARAGLKLTVLLPSGAPAAGIDVTLEDAEGGTPPRTRRLVGPSFPKAGFTDTIRGTTGEDGEVRFTDLLPGRYLVRLPDRQWEIDLGEDVESRTVWLE